MAKKTAASAALVALLMASAGGYQFLKKNPNPTLRDVYVACESGKVSGVACCEDVLRVKNFDKMLQECGMISPSNPDPFGVRAQEETDWDKLQAQQIREMPR